MAEPAPPATLEPELERYLEHLRVERRLAPRSLAMIRSALAGLAAQAAGAQRVY